MKYPVTCPLKEKCRTKTIVYEATISNQTKSFIYVGITESEFKTRYADHKKSMKGDRYQLSTMLSVLEDKELRQYSICIIESTAEKRKEKYNL